MISPKTLREFVGLKPPESIDPARTALLLIDIQNDYFDPAALPIPDGPRVVEKASRLLDWADAAGMAVIHIQHVSPNPKAALFASGGSGAEIHTGVSPRTGHRLIQKTLPSSFAATALDETLKALGIQTLVVCGMMTHMCVDSTVRHALHLGYRSIVAADACASRDLASHSGEIIPAKVMHEASLAALADRFADVMSVAAILALPVAA